MTDLSRAGEWASPEVLPDHLRRLHRRAQAAARASRDARIPHTLAHRDENDRRWPGLVNPNDNEGATPK